VDLVKHHKTNYKKVVDLSEQSWGEALQHSITSINASVSGVNQYQCMNTNNVFSHFCTTSYLGLEFHPSVFWDLGVKLNFLQQAPYFLLLLCYYFVIYFI
jgi:hypothetical protein